MISALKARKQLSSGCVGYLANTVDLSKEGKLTLEDVPVVKEFVGVFSEELLRFPLDREIVFEI